MLLITTTITYARVHDSESLENGASNSTTVNLEQQYPSHDGFGVSLVVLAALICLALVARQFDRPS